MVVTTRSVAKLERKEAMISLLPSTPDEIFQEVGSFLSARDLVSLEATCHRFQEMNFDSSWKERCRERWEDWPRYRRLFTLEDRLRNIAPDWKGRYRWVEGDVSRTELTEEDLESLQWYFNFLPRSGGTGRSSLVKCRFRNGRMSLTGYPPLQYSLVLQALEDDDEDEFLDYVYLWNANIENRGFSPFEEECDGGCFEPKPGSRHVKLQVAQYPTHRVRRMKKDGEWLITNPFVTIVSCDANSRPTFTGRGFQ